MVDRRDFIMTCSAVGLGGTLFPGVLWAQVEALGAKKITKEMIENAAIIADVPIADEYREMILEGLNKQAKGYEEIYKLHIANSVAPAVLFDPVLPGMAFETTRKALRMSESPSVAVPGSVDALAFASVRELAELVRTKNGYVQSRELTENLDQYVVPAELGNRAGIAGGLALAQQAYQERQNQVASIG